MTASLSRLAKLWLRLEPDVRAFLTVLLLYLMIYAVVDLIEFVTWEVICG